MLAPGRPEYPQVGDGGHHERRAEAVIVRVGPPAEGRDGLAELLEGVGIEGGFVGVVRSDRARVEPVELLFVGAFGVTERLEVERVYITDAHPAWSSIEPLDAVLDQLHGVTLVESLRGCEHPQLDSLDEEPEVVLAVGVLDDVQERLGEVLGQLVEDIGVLTAAPVALGRDAVKQFGRHLPAALLGIGTGEDDTCHLVLRRCDRIVVRSHGRCLPWLDE